MLIYRKRASGGAVVVSACLATISLFAPPAAGQAPRTVQVSVDSSGVQANAQNGTTSISGDGRIVAFESFASNLVPGVTGDHQDLFLHDRVSGITELVSISLSGSQGNGHSSYPSLSETGRFVCFFSNASDLVVGDVNGWGDVFVRDRQTGVTTLVSVSSSGQQADLGAGQGSISSDSRFVVFASASTNLAPPKTTIGADVFLHDLLTGLTEKVTFGLNGAEMNGSAERPVVSGDGRYVAFRATTDNLVPSVTTLEQHIYLYDRMTGVTELISVSSAGVPGNQWSDNPSISDDGRFVSFGSHANQLVPGDNNFSKDVFVRDRLLGLTFLASVSSAGVQGNSDSRTPDISPDGRFVAFRSASTNLAPGGVGALCYVRDLELGQTWIASVDSGGNPGNFFSQAPSIASGARAVAFQSAANNLVPGPWNGHPQIYTHNRAGCPFPQIYCQPSKSSLFFCPLTLEFFHAPSAGSPDGFWIHTSAPGGAFAFCLVGSSGPASTPLGTQGGFLCVEPPLWRTPPQQGGGQPVNCNGYYTVTLADIAAATPLVVPGAELFAQLWARDPANPDGFALSDAVRFTVCP